VESQTVIKARSIHKSFPRLALFEAPWPARRHKQDNPDGDSFQQMPFPEATSQRTEVHRILKEIRRTPQAVSTEAWLANRRPNEQLPPSSKEITECTVYCIQFVANVNHLHQAATFRAASQIFGRSRLSEGASVRAGVERRRRRVFARQRLSGIHAQILMREPYLSLPRAPLPSPWRHSWANRVIDDAGVHWMTPAYTRTVENTVRLFRKKTAARLPF